jgi:hypothetical protein
MTFSCLVVIVVTIPSCRIVAFFIFFTIQVSVSSTIKKFCYRVVKTSFTCFSSTWVFSNFYWFSWKFSSNCLQPITKPTLFLFHSYLWDSNQKD